MARLIQGDLRQVLPTMEPNSVDAIVTDPPYEWTFMGKHWDTTGVAFDPATWTECLRVLKPGGHVVAMGGSRTFHRLACAIEDAGFEIRDAIADFYDTTDAARAFLDSLSPEQLDLLTQAWPTDHRAFCYGSGFPKSLDVSKQLDKAAGAKREVIGEYRMPEDSDAGNHGKPTRARGDGGPFTSGGNVMVTAPATDAAREWAGFGTATKPAWEPIILARKPLAAPNVASNVLHYRAGALNIDGCRIEGVKDTPASPRRAPQHATYGDLSNDPGTGSGWRPEVGRWPANVVLSHAEGCELAGTRQVRGSRIDKPSGPTPNSGYMGSLDSPRPSMGYGDDDGMEMVEAWRCVETCPVRLLDEQTGILTSGANTVKRDSGTNNGYVPNALGAESRPAGSPMIFYGDRGGASRFFYTAKASRSERNAGLEHLSERPILWSAGTQNPGSFQSPNTNRASQNYHPTVKPISLMRWLVRLVSPPGRGTVLDPFVGSGSTGCAAALEGVDFIGIDLDADYLAIAEKRIAYWSAQAARGRQLPLQAAAAD